MYFFIKKTINFLKTIKLIIWWICHFAAMNPNLIVYIIYFIIQIIFVIYYHVNTFNAGTADLIISDIEAASMKKEGVAMDLAISDIINKLQIDRKVYQYLSDIDTFKSFPTEVFQDFILKEKKSLALQGYTFEYLYLSEGDLCTIFAANKEVELSLLNLRFSEENIQKYLEKSFSILEKEKLIAVETAIRNDNLFYSKFFRFLNKFGLYSNLESLDDKLEKIEQIYLEKKEIIKEEYFSSIENIFKAKELELILESNKIKESLRKDDFYFFSRQIQRAESLFKDELSVLLKKSAFNDSFPIEAHSDLSDIRHTVVKKCIINIHNNALYTSALFFEPFTDVPNILTKDLVSVSEYMLQVHKEVKSMTGSPEFMEIMQSTNSWDLKYERVQEACNDRFLIEFEKKSDQILERNSSDKQNFRRKRLILKKIFEKDPDLILNSKIRWLNILISLNSRK